ncbi:hypothetical protein F4809DRAFT_86230 [Biscogniauxia mediterranea]|nr:hypothetical protein F4809DRAFT_86230 [Biscogniauxia mediterranea]
MKVSTLEVARGGLVPITRDDTKSLLHDQRPRNGQTAAPHDPAPLPSRQRVMIRYRPNRTWLHLPRNSLVGRCRASRLGRPVGAAHARNVVVRLDSERNIPPVRVSPRAKRSTIPSLADCFVIRPLPMGFAKAHPLQENSGRQVVCPVGLIRWQAITKLLIVALGQQGQRGGSPSTRQEPY